MNLKPIQEIHSEALKLPIEKDQHFCRYEYVKAIYEKYLEELIEADYKYEQLYIAEHYHHLTITPKRKNEFNLIHKCIYPPYFDIQTGFIVELQINDLQYMGLYCRNMQQYLLDLKKLMYHPSIYKDGKRLYDLINNDGQMVKNYYKFTFTNGKLYKIYYDLRKIKGKMEELYSGVKEASCL